MKSTAQQALPLNADTIIATLNLEKHVEGGYYRRTFESGHREKIQTKDGERFTMTSIYYLLTAEHPIGHFHLNKSDIIHFFHSGDPITYHLFSPKGEYKSFKLGNNIVGGEAFQFVVPGGWWKASEISPDGYYGYGLISEAVSPGFDFDDMRLGDFTSLSKQFPDQKQLIRKLTRN
jgi:predicted cupin superfamily sugar epimerase